MLTRKAVRQGVVARFVAATDEPLASADEEQIFDTRGNPAQPDELLAIHVDMPLQRDEQLSVGTPEYRIVSTLFVEVQVSKPRAEGQSLRELDAVAAAEVDDYLTAIKKTLFEDPTWVCQFERLLRIETATEPESVASRSKVVGKLTIDVQWYRSYTIKPEHYTPLEGVDVKTDLHTPPDKDHAEVSQVIDLEQIP